MKRNFHSLRKRADWITSTRDTISLKARNGRAKPTLYRARRDTRPIEILITLALLIVRVPRIISFNHFNYLLHVIKHGLLHSC